jgi:stress-induced morphogen
MAKLNNLKTKLDDRFPESQIMINGLSDLPEHYAPTGRSGSHIEINVKSRLFKDKSLLDQHKMIHEAIEELMQMNGGFIHAVTIKTSL